MGCDFQWKSLKRSTTTRFRGGHLGTLPAFQALSEAKLRWKIHHFEYFRDRRQALLRKMEIWLEGDDAIRVKMVKNIYMF